MLIKCLQCSKSCTKTVFKKLNNIHVQYNIMIRLLEVNIVLNLRNEIVRGKEDKNI